jgi:hypothetical protein
MIKTSEKSDHFSRASFVYILLIIDQPQVSPMVVEKL